MHFVLLRTIMKSCTCSLPFFHGFHMIKWNEKSIYLPHSVYPLFFLWWLHFIENLGSIFLCTCQHGFVMQIGSPCMFIASLFFRVPSFLMCPNGPNGHTYVWHLTCGTYFCIYWVDTWILLILLCNNESEFHIA